MRTKHILLTTGEVVAVDAADFAYLNEFSWYGKKQHNQVHAYRKTMIGKKLVGVRMQRQITEATPDEIINFLDGDTLNCTRDNLVVLRRNRATGKFLPRTPGVSLNRKSYRVRIGVQGSSINLGSYESLDDANAAYDEAQIALYGSRAVTSS